VDPIADLPAAVRRRHSLSETRALQVIVWQGGVMGSRRLAVGCEFTYEAQVATLAVFQVQPGASMLCTHESESWVSTPELALRSYTDLYGNPCIRVELPAGWSSLRYQALVRIVHAVGDADESAQETSA
jgi:hypothetical protein